MTHTRAMGTLVALVLVGGAHGLAPATQAEAPVVQQATSADLSVWYFYRVTWGQQEEFLDLFQKNHYPVIKAQLGDQLAGFKAYVPTYHGDGRADWTFATELIFRASATPTTPSETDAIVRRLYDDFDVFRDEERRRFEILDAHWDVPLTGVDFDTRVPSGP